MSQPFFSFLQVILSETQPVKMCMHVHCVCISVLARSWVSLPAWRTGCLSCAMPSQKGGELGLSIPECKPQQWLDKAALGVQPITSLCSILHSYRCTIGAGVAGRGMDRQQRRRDVKRGIMFPFTESQRRGSYSFPSLCTYRTHGIIFIWPLKVWWI